MSVSWECNPFPLPETGWDTFSPLTNTQDPLAWASAYTQTLLKTRGLVSKALHIWMLDSKSTMWILLIPHWERISELRVIIHNGPNPKSPSKAAMTSEGAQTQIQTSGIYPSSKGPMCNINTTQIPGDKSKPQTCWCPSCAWYIETGFSSFPIKTGNTTGMAGSKGHDLLFCFSVLLCSCLFSPRYCKSR